MGRHPLHPLRKEQIILLYKRPLTPWCFLRELPLLQRRCQTLSSRWVLHTLKGHNMRVPGLTAGMSGMYTARLSRKKEKKNSNQTLPLKALLLDCKRLTASSLHCSV